MKKILIALVVFVSLLQISCNTENISDAPTVNPVDVYVAGSKDGKACYWKNEQLFYLDVNNSSSPISNDLIVKNNVVHVLGTNSTNNGSYEYDNIYWRNGVFTNLNESFSTNNEIVKGVLGMDVVGNDVYFVGYTKNTLIAAEIYSLVYWKNGIKTIVNNNLPGICYNSNIKVLNNDVYITASNKIPTYNYFCISNGFYKNTLFTEIQDSNLRGFTIKNNDVYVFGDYLSNSIINNITANSSVIIGFNNDIGILNLCFDNNNMYSYSNKKIYKNASLIYTHEDSLIYYSTGIYDVKVLNENLYKLEGVEGTTFKQNIDVNGTTLFSTLSGEQFNALCIVQN